MDKYRVEVSTRAARTYQKIYESALEHLDWDRDGAAHPSVALLRTLDDLIESFISRDPFARLRLAGPLSQVYWVSVGRLRVFFTTSQKPMTVVIVCIATTPRTVSSFQRADAIIHQLLLSGHIRLGIAAGSALH